MVVASVVLASVVVASVVVASVVIAFAPGGSGDQPKSGFKIDTFGVQVVEGMPDERRYHQVGVVCD